MGRKGRGYPTAEFKLTLLQRLAPAIGVLIGMVVGTLSSWVALGSLDVGETVHMVVFSALGGGIASLVGSAGFGVTLTPWAVEVRNLRRRVIQWPDVRLIQVEKRSFSSNRMVVVYEFSGRRTRLRAPITGFLVWDRNFEQKYHTIGRWWLEHREIQPAGDGPHDALPSGLQINDAVPSTVDAVAVADAVPPGSSSPVPRRGLN